VTPAEVIATAAFAPVVAALGAGPIPGAVLGVVTASGDRALRVGGRASIAPHQRPMTADTWFDLASLT
jgi:CubicO group peptidase (beta-lactamase class C family)